MKTRDEAMRAFGRWPVFIGGTLSEPAEPAFHARGEPEKIESPNLRGWETRTVCGRLLYRMTWQVNLAGQTIEGSHRQRDSATRVHVAHAIEFARPCRRCFPEEASR